MSAFAEAKKSARAAGFAARERAHAEGVGAARQAAGHALETIGAFRHVRTVSAYLPIRTELDPVPAMLALFGLGYRLGVPVIDRRGLPLRFRAWTPEASLAPGPLGTWAPLSGDWVEPDLLLVPLLAFDARCYRLGYGGGYYDRTLHDLRERGPVHAFGLAYAGQEIEAVPHDATMDAHLDGIITEKGLRLPS